MRYVVTGANRGIGLELVQQLLKRKDTVVAAVRKPASAPALAELARTAQERLLVLTCDVSNDASVAAFAATAGPAVDVLINNAGVMGDSDSLEDMDFEDALRTFSINALGPLRVTRALLPALRRGLGKKVLHVTSGMGSIGDNTSGGYYAYRMSKAALNMASRSLARDFQSDGIVSAVINPGWVKTDMGGSHAPTSVEVSVRGILEQLDRMSASESGEFLDYQGRTWPW